jgi:hypothetical protein
VKAGQRHACQRVASQSASRRAAEWRKLADLLAGAGMALVTSVEEYAGYRAPVSYRVGSDATLRSARPYRLQRLAADRMAAAGALPDTGDGAVVCAGAP